MIMKLKLVFLMLLLGGCGESRSNAILSGQATIENWQKVLECDSGAVTIDVDTFERRHMQVVVRDTRLFPYFDSSMIYGQIRNVGERVYRGRTSDGVFDQQHFINVYAYDPIGTATSRQGFEARRIGDSVVFRGLDFVKTNCGGSLRGDNYASCEVANYVFRSCH